MKNSILSLLFLGITGFSFYQCQKDTTVANTPNATSVQQSPEDRGMSCPISVTSDVGGYICGSTTGSGVCTSCGNLNGVGGASFAPNATYTFTPSNVICTVRNPVDIPGTFVIYNSNSFHKFILPGNGCQDFYMSGCNIILL